MKILVTVAGTHGATAEIRGTIAAHRTEAGHDTAVRDPDEVRGRALHAAVGDLRDWDAIADWSRGIDDALRTTAD